jgi:hypothetical protein
MSYLSDAPPAEFPASFAPHLSVPDVEPIPPIDPTMAVPAIFGNGALFKFGVNGGDLNKVFHTFETRVRQSPDDAGLKLDFALVHLLLNRPVEAYELQRTALERQKVFRVVGTAGQERPVRRRVLAFVAPGDFTNNAQLEFILDGADIGLDVLYVVPGQPLPAALPEHDVAFCAVNESDENLPVLERLAELLPRWPRPVVNVPDKITRLSRDGVASLLHGSKSICAPEASRLALSQMRSIATVETSLEAALPGFAYPVLVRPVGSHGGKNLAKIDDAPALGTYLEGLKGYADDFFVTPFVDYRGADGLFRKYRLVFFEGEPFLCHMAVSDKWMIHYINVGMAEDEGKRAQEAEAMETFETGFAVRHRAAFADLYQRLGLDFFIVDCAELPDGRLLLFEADIAMVIHSIDSPAIFPYKQGQMAKVFSAFCAMVGRASQRPPGLRGN